MAYFREMPSRSLISLGPSSLRSRSIATSLVWIESRARAGEGRRVVEDEGAESAEAVGTDAPVAVEADHPSGRLQPFEKGAKSLGAERHATREGRQAHAAGADMTDMLLQHDLRAPRLQQREMFDQGRTLALEARGVDVEQGPPADRHDRRVRAH